MTFATHLGILSKQFVCMYSYAQIYTYIHAYAYMYIPTHTLYIHTLYVCMYLWLSMIGTDIRNIVIHERISEAILLVLHYKKQNLGQEE